jgi:hypothetical protein
MTVATRAGRRCSACGQHALDVRRHSAIPAQYPVPPEQPHLARLGNRVRRRIRHVVGIGPPPSPRQVKAVELQLAQLDR